MNSTFKMSIFGSGKRFNSAGMAEAVAASRVCANEVSQPKNQ